MRNFSTIVGKDNTLVIDFFDEVERFKASVKEAENFLISLFEVDLDYGVLLTPSEERALRSLRSWAYRNRKAASQGQSPTSTYVYTNLNTGNSLVVVSFMTKWSGSEIPSGQLKVPGANYFYYGALPNKQLPSSRGEPQPGLKIDVDDVVFHHSMRAFNPKP